MNLLNTTLAIILLQIFPGIQIATAEQHGDMGSSSVREMAEILINLNHYPSPSEKKDLLRISNDKTKSQGERVLATAILNMQHKVTAADQEELRKLVNDSMAPAEVRDMAAILMGINHKPSAADKDKLRKMMN